MIRRRNCQMIPFRCSTPEASTVRFLVRGDASPSTGSGSCRERAINNWPIVRLTRPREAGIDGRDLERGPENTAVIDRRFPTDNVLCLTEFSRWRIDVDHHGLWINVAVPPLGRFGEPGPPA